MLQTALQHFIPLITMAPLGVDISGLQGLHSHFHSTSWRLIMNHLLKECLHLMQFLHGRGLRWVRTRVATLTVRVEMNMIVHFHRRLLIHGPILHVKNPLVDRSTSHFISSIWSFMYVCTWVDHTLLIVLVSIHTQAQNVTVSCHNPPNKANFKH